MRVFIMDTWAYPYRLPVFECLHKQIEVEAFFSRLKPFDHRDSISMKGCSFRSYCGHWLFALMPVHLLWRKYDVYMVGQIGVESVAGAFFTLLVSRLRRKPLILWTDYIQTTYYRKTKMIKRLLGDFIRKIFLGYCSAAIGFGSYTERYLKRVGRKGLPIFNIKQVVPETCYFSPSCEMKKMHYANKIVVLSVGYLRVGKGQDILIRTFKNMRRSDAVLVIAGSGVEEQKLKSLAGDSEHIQFVGHLEDEQKAEYYAAADIFVLSTEHDTWGLVVNEAMHYGLPVIVTDAAGASELISDNGIVIQPGNEEMLRRALTRLIENESLRKKMGEKSKTYISPYGVEYAAASFARIIRQVNDRTAC